MKIAKIVLIALIAGIAIFMIFGSKIAKQYQKKYYNKNYQPEWIDASLINGYPSGFHIDGIPWISYEKAYCQPTALQMIAYKQGIKEDLGYFNFLTGFTYGAFYRADMGVLYPYTDPISGFITAAPYLGLRMRYFVTDDEGLFLKTIKFYISRGYPVGAELDVGKLRGDTEFLPHLELIVGYYDKKIEYYETTDKEQVRLNVKGIMADEQKIAEAVMNNSKSFMHPWKYAFMIFEKIEKKDDPKDIWARNGTSMVGSRMGIMFSGSFAMHELALGFKKTGKLKYDVSTDAISYTRIDNAKFLAGHFKSDKDVQDAAAFLMEEGRIYEEVLPEAKNKITSKEEIAKITEKLGRAALLEKQAGDIFLKKSGVKAK